MGTPHFLPWRVSHSQHRCDPSGKSSVEALESSPTFLGVASLPAQKLPLVPNTYQLSALAWRACLPRLLASLPFRPVSPLPAEDDVHFPTAPPEHSPWSPGSITAPSWPSQRPTPPGSRLWRAEHSRSCSLGKGYVLPLWEGCFEMWFNSWIKT